MRIPLACALRSTTARGQNHGWLDRGMTGVSSFRIRLVSRLIQACRLKQTLFASATTAMSEDHIVYRMS